MTQAEFSASELRKIFQELFPHRKLVLSQFTFYNQVGVAKPSGETFRRGRRCYRLVDLLPIATVLALKEKGIPLKNIEVLPRLLQESAERIFSFGTDCLISGYGEQVHLQMPDEDGEDLCLEAFLAEETQTMLYWSFDVGKLAAELQDVVARYSERYLRAA